MTGQIEAFILKTKAGQWKVEIWRDGEPVECIAGLETEMDAIEEASNLAAHYEGMRFVIRHDDDRI